MDTLGKTQAEREHVKALLRKKYGTQQNAAKQIGISKFALSRILNGQRAELSQLVAILQGSGHLTRKKYRYPKFDLSTFMFLNGIMDFSLK